MVCACAVIAGDNVTITGNGTPANPYKVSAVADVAAVGLDTPTVDTTVTGAGTPGDPFMVSGAVKISTTPNNCATTDATGVFVPCPDGSETEVQAGTNVTVTGTGTTADPYVVSSTGGGAGTPVTVLDTPTVDLTLVGQQIAADVRLDPAGPLEANANGLTIDPGCGLEIVGGELAVNTTPWTLACAQETHTEDVYCSSVDGRLQIRHRQCGGDGDQLLGGGGGIGVGGRRSAGTATITADLTDYCNDVTLTLFLAIGANYTSTGGNNIRLTSERVIDGGAPLIFTLTGEPNIEAGTHERGAIVSASPFQLAAGVVHTITLTTFLENNAGPILTANFIRTGLAASWYENCDI